MHCRTFPLGRFRGTRRRPPHDDGFLPGKSSGDFEISRRVRRGSLPVHTATPLTRRIVHQRDGRGSGIVMGVWIMAGITFREAARKKILWTALLAGVGFLLVFGVGLRFQV